MSISDIPVTFWLVIVQAIFLTGSSLVLSVQRAYEHRQHATKTAHLKVDTARDIVNVPFANGNRMTRIVFDTLVVTITSGYLLVTHALNGDRQNELFIYTIVGSASTFVAWIYCLVLATTATRFPLPSTIGWTINVDLCILYTVLFISSVTNLVLTLWSNPYISLVQSLPLALPTLFGFDLVYSTATVKNGSPFLDENGKPVNGYNVESIAGVFFFFWITPIINHINLKSKSSKLTDEDLPRLPPTHRAHNMFYTFGETRGKRLLWRIYLGSFKSINMQALLACVLPTLYYATPFFLNRLLVIIQDISSGSGDDRSIIRGLGYIFGMSVFMIITNVLIAQLWFNGQSATQMRIKSMLNIEIYRKTLRRMDTSVLSGGKTNNKGDAKDDDDKKKEDGENNEKIEENNVSSMTGMIVNLMSTDSARISDFASWWFVMIEAPIELCIGIYFLYTLLGWSCFVGLMVMVITLPINHFNAKIFVKTQDQLMKARDKRVSLMNEVLQGIRQIKFFAWESNWTKRILESRNIELAHLRTVYIGDMVFMLLWQGTPLIVTTVAFWSFTRLEGKELTAPIAFTSITIFNELRSALSIIPETFIRLFESLISVDRIEKYLDEDEIKQPVSTSTVNSHAPSINEEATTVNHPSSSDVVIGFENATITWPTSSSASSKNATEEPPRITVSASAQQQQEILVEVGGSESADSTWESTLEQEEQNTFMLKDLNVLFPNNQLSLICGATGSGKTLLMLSLLGETETRKGAVYCPRSASSSSLDDSTAITNIKVSQDADAAPPDWILQHAVAYVSQTAWLQNASIKDNILFGLPFVKKRYVATLATCALVKDLSYLEDGDETEIGEKGITLSGGQKARVALARAVYSRAQNVLMDDVLSAVDAHTAKHLYKQCLLGKLMKGRTQILITHHVNLCIRGSAHVVFVKDGRVKLSGSPDELKERQQLALIFEENIQKQVNGEKEKEEEEEEQQETVETEASAEAGEKKKPKALVEDEARASGMVKLRLYKFYLQLVGNWLFWVFIFVCVIGVRSLDVSATWWLSKWARSYEIEGGTLTTNVFSFSRGMENESSASAIDWPMTISSKINALASIPTVLSESEKSDKLNMYLGIYVLLNLCNIILGVIRYGTMFHGGLKASKELYILLLDRVFRAPLRFFDRTPIGRIVNRFSKDFETIDSRTSMDFIQFAVQITTVVSIIVAASSVFPALMIVLIFVAAVNIYIGLQFVSASRELKRMDSVSRSPLFTHFSETIIGVSTIRAFGMTQQFMLDMLNRIDVNARPMYYSWTISRWISTRMGLIGSLITFVTGVFILLNLDHLDAATAGFCLSYVLTFTNMTYWGVRRYTVLEMSFNSVERVVEFLEMDQEALTITDVRVPSDWPDQGAIEINDLHVRYAVDLEPVLEGLNLSIKPQEKVGIVGRTGSGKSTLALSFFRFIEAYQGSIVIDGINIADIGTEDLRGNLTIIPQDPVLFSGTLQSNMDPFNQFTEEEIFTALRRVHLLNDSAEDDINENVFKDLKSSVSEGGKNFSQGQRQLLCLARALLKRSRVVLMDEATASVDFETDKAIQKTITTEFAECTILCIAHRLNTVIEYDRILVLVHGEVLEFASPLDLLRDTNSAFYHMCRNSGEFENLLELAKTKHELVDIS